MPMVKNKKLLYLIEEGSRVWFLDGMRLIELSQHIIFVFGQHNLLLLVQFHLDFLGITQTILQVDHLQQNQIRRLANLR